MTGKLTRVEIAMAIVGVACVVIVVVGVAGIGSAHPALPFWTLIAAIIVGGMIRDHFFPSRAGGDGGWFGDGGCGDGGGE